MLPACDAGRWILESLIATECVPPNRSIRICFCHKIVACFWRHSLICALAPQYAFDQFSAKQAAASLLRANRGGLRHFLGVKNARAFSELSSRCYESLVGLNVFLFLYSASHFQSAIFVRLFLCGGGCCCSRRCRCVSKACRNLFAGTWINSIRWVSTLGACKHTRAHKHARARIRIQRS